MSIGYLRSTLMSKDVNIQKTVRTKVSCSIILNIWIRFEERFFIRSWKFSWSYCDQRLHNGFIFFIFWVFKDSIVHVTLLLIRAIWIPAVTSWTGWRWTIAGSFSFVTIVLFSIKYSKNFETFCFLICLFWMLQITYAKCHAIV